MILLTALGFIVFAILTYLVAFWCGYSIKLHAEAEMARLREVLNWKTPNRRKKRASFLSKLFR